MDSRSVFVFLLLLLLSILMYSLKCQKKTRENNTVIVSILIRDNND